MLRGEGIARNIAQEEMDEELIAAAGAGNVPKLRELIDKGANIEARDWVRLGGAESCLQVPPT